jgi:hypothetical protein
MKELFHLLFLMGNAEYKNTPNPYLIYNARLLKEHAQLFCDTQNSGKSTTSSSVAMQKRGFI